MSAPAPTRRAAPAEENLIGSLLLGAAVPALRADDMEDPRHRLIFPVITELPAGTADPTTVANRLSGLGHLEAAGGLAYLSELARTTLRADNVSAYADIVREHASRRRLAALLEESAGGAEFRERLEREVARLQTGAPRGSQSAAIQLRHIADIVSEQREPRWLAGLHKILERGVLAVLAGPRNTFKSFIGLHWAMTAALNQEPAVILSAEGAGLDRRVDAWMRTYAPAVDLRGLPLVALERAVNLNAASTIEALRDAIDARRMKPAMGLIDTFSKYAPGLEENDNAEVALYLSMLSAGLRDHYDCALLLVAHAGHGDAKRPRGASVLMANPDAEYIVERPDPTAMTATVTRERFKDSAALPSLAYAAHVIDLGRLDSHGDPVTSLVMRDTELRAVPGKNRELHGKAQRQLLAALRAHSTADGAGVWTLADIREIGRTAGLHKNTARAAAEALTFTPHLTASVGGWKLCP